MFLELHLVEKNKKIMLNINRINSIIKMGKNANIYIGEVVYLVTESYDDIVERIDKYYNA